MILDLDISGLGVIDSAQLEIGPGFTALTGETGAGKTMILTALQLLLGGRANPGTVRPGHEKAVIEGHWQVLADGVVASQVEESGGDVEANGDVAEVVMVRQVSAQGRSRAWLGGTSVPAGTLTDLAPHLVVIHGQSEQQRLRSETAQRDALDGFGGAKIRTAKDRVATAHAAHRRAVKELERIRKTEAERTREAEELRQAIADIEPLNPIRGEEAELAARVERLTNREALRSSVATAAATLRGDDALAEAPSAAALITAARSALEHASSLDEAVRPILDQLVSAEYELTEAASAAAGYLDDLDRDGVGELDDLNARLAALRDLMRRYGPSLDEVIDRYERAGARLVELEGDGDLEGRLREEAESAEKTLTEAADALTALREKAAENLSKRVSTELGALAMPNAELVATVAPSGQIAAHGQDRVELLLRAHPGAQPVPITKAASGGELSRIMLALEVALADDRPVPTFVFDEVDAGVGGAAAIEIGRRLKALSERSQVIVVTHLAQVAAFADQHLRIEKTTDGERTRSHVTALDDEARIREIARLLSGLEDSDSGREHALELIRLAEG